MTTDKLPDVIGCVQHDCAECQAKQSSLDAMTAERDKWRNDGEAALLTLGKNILDVARERDSAREALAKACEVVREYLECDRLMQMDGCPDDRFSPALTALRALAAQPETKP